MENVFDKNKDEVKKTKSKTEVKVSSDFSRSLVQPQLPTTTSSSSSAHVSSSSSAHVSSSQVPKKAHVPEQEPVSKRAKIVIESDVDEDEDEEEEDDEEEEEEEDDDDENISEIVSSDEEEEVPVIPPETEEQIAKAEADRIASSIKGSTLVGGRTLRDRSKIANPTLDRYGDKERELLFIKDEKKELIREVKIWRTTPELVNKRADLAWPVLNLKMSLDDIRTEHEKVRVALGLDSTDEESEDDVEDEVEDEEVEEEEEEEEEEESDNSECSESETEMDLNDEKEER
jgi:E3 ubiquitin-protein ligase HUWE1